MTGTAQTTEKSRCQLKTTGTSVTEHWSIPLVFTVPWFRADDARRSAQRRRQWWSTPRRHRRRCACNACRTRCQPRRASWNPIGRNCMSLDWDWTKFHEKTHLAAEGASVLAVLRDFHLLDHLTQRGTITGTIFTNDSNLLGALGLRTKTKAHLVSSFVTNFSGTKFVGLMIHTAVNSFISKRFMPSLHLLLVSKVASLKDCPHIHKLISYHFSVLLICQKIQPERAVAC